MMPQIRVLALHHNLILREGISVLIGMQEDMILVGSVPGPDAAIGLFDKERPDLTLIDLDLPSDAGLGALHRIRGIDPDAAVIGLVTDDWDESGMRAIEAGAATVLAKDLIGDLLVPFIRGAVAGRSVRNMKQGHPQF
jgi:DNA-binding NarL/FixJ family response regulator